MSRCCLLDSIFDSSKRLLSVFVPYPTPSFFLYFWSKKNKKTKENKTNKWKFVDGRKVRLTCSENETKQKQKQRFFFLSSTFLLSISLWSYPIFVFHRRCRAPASILVLLCTQEDDQLKLVAPFLQCILWRRLAWPRSSSEAADDSWCGTGQERRKKHRPRLYITSKKSRLFSV